jgi:hypothetical protein
MKARQLKYALQRQGPRRIQAEGMERYPEDGTPPNYVAITKIVVPTQRDKDELLRAIEYIHYLRELDTDYIAVNTLAHMYLRPELIEVAP